MAISLASLRTSTVLSPPRVLIHGVAGIGKSTFAASADAPVFVLTEDGLGKLQVLHFPLATSYAEVAEALDALLDEDHSYPHWNRHASRATTEFEVATWSTWPGCGVGIVGGSVAALDIDIAEDGELALRIERLARERLGDTPALRIGKPPKRLLVYRTSEPFAGIRRTPLEVLCLGQQFVPYAEHPDTGRPYTWPDEGLADLDIESLPAIDATQAAAFLDEALALIPPELRPKSLGVKGANGAGHPCLPAHSQAGTLAAIRSALAWLPNAELDYDSWMRIGIPMLRGTDFTLHASAGTAGTNNTSSPRTTMTAT